MYWKYKIITPYKRVINFSSLNTNPITFKLFFSSYSGNNLKNKLPKERKLPEEKEAKAKKATIRAEKEVKVQARKEVKKAEAIARKVIQT